jgi:hypothetical protein
MTRAAIASMSFRASPTKSWQLRRVFSITARLNLLASTAISGTLSAGRLFVAPKVANPEAGQMLDPRLEPFTRELFDKR